MPDYESFGAEFVDRFEAAGVRQVAYLRRVARKENLVRALVKELKEQKVPGGGLGGFGRVLASDGKRDDVALS